MNLINRVINRIKYLLNPEHRFFPRYDIKEADQIRAFFSLEGAGAYLHNYKMLEEPHQVISLSESGIALFLLEGEDPEFFKTQSELTLRLVIEEKLLTIPCKVAYVLEEIKRIGLKFIQLPEQQLEVISKFLDVRFLASSIKEIPVKKQGAQVCRWFHGQNNTDIFSWQDQRGKFVHFLFIFVNNAVEWTVESDIRTGRVKCPDFALTTLFSSEPNPIDFDEIKNKETIETANNIIRLSKIDPGIKRHLLDLL